CLGEDTQLRARLGGDEFAILTPQTGDSAERLAERILATLAAVPAASGPVIATSIGVAVYPDDAEDQRALLSYADAALYRAKAEGRGTCRRYDASMGAVTVQPDPAVAIPESAIRTEWLATAVALASCLILLLAGAALALDLRERKRTAFERERLRSLANAAVEGLVVCRSGQIVSANEAFARLTGLDTAALV
ncbi:diguanylate cyclase, partial [Methylobacterium sp. E-065]|uniref:diguanylate cyclase domain-containing protein n=1 Tax=Methylobacterium sp. E-065 TaxID=2836583 RepID=UPI001FB8EC45